MLIGLWDGLFHLATNQLAQGQENCDEKAYKTAKHYTDV